MAAASFIEVNREVVAKEAAFCSSEDDGIAFFLSQHGRYDDQTHLGISFRRL